MLTALPNAENVVISWLLSLTAVTSVTSEVGTALSVGQTYPAVRVTRVGGTVNEDPWFDNPRVQVEFWGSQPNGTEISQSTLDTLTRTVVASVVDLTQATFGNGVITSAYVSIGPLPSPDPTTHRYRQLIEITLEVENP